MSSLGAWREVPVERRLAAPDPFRDRGDGEPLDVPEVLRVADLLVTERTGTPCAEALRLGDGAGVGMSTNDRFWTPGPDAQNPPDRASKIRAQND